MLLYKAYIHFTRSQKIVKIKSRPLLNEQKLQLLYIITQYSLLIVHTI